MNKDQTRRVQERQYNNRYWRRGSLITSLVSYPYRVHS